MASTTVKVSKETARRLSNLQHRLHTRSIDETIRMLEMRYRDELLSEAFGKDRGKLKAFREEDRGEDRS